MRALKMQNTLKPKLAEMKLKTLVAFHGLWIKIQFIRTLEAWV